MKYPYLVVHNGIEYPAGTDVPVEEIKSVENDAVQENENVVEKPATAPKLTKTDINRTPLAELKRLAKENGIKNSNTKSGAELKKELIEVLGL